MRLFVARNTCISAYEPSVEELFVPRYDEKFDVRTSNFLHCAPITSGILFYQCTVLYTVQCSIV